MIDYDVSIRKLNGVLTEDCFIKNKEFLISGKRAKLFYSDGLVDVEALDQFVVYPLSKLNRKSLITEKVLKSVITHVEISFEKNIDFSIMKVFDGDSLLVIEGVNCFSIIGAKKWEKRAVTEPPTSAVIKGPREGFTEDLQLNISLIKRKLKTPSLKFEFIELGKYSRTNVAITYLSDICDPNILFKVKERLNKIDVDGILDSSYLKGYLQEKKFSVFKQIGDTEKPDILSAKLLEGRIGIIVDGSPIALTLPYVVIEDFQSAEDYYSIPYHASFVRVLRFISMCVGVYTPGFYVAAQLYHIQFIPLRFLLTIASAVKGIPLSPNIEMLFTLFIFELLNEASIRMPKYVGMALSVVGALVLGDTAVRAGIVSTPTILIMALSGIAVYSVPDQRNTLSILRLVFLLVSGSFGLIGLIASTIIICFYLNRLSNYQAPYLSPYAPNVENDISDSLTKSPLTTTNERPHSYPNTNKTRLKWKN